MTVHIYLFLGPTVISERQGQGLWPVLGVAALQSLARGWLGTERALKNICEVNAYQVKPCARKRLKISYMPSLASSPLPDLVSMPDSTDDRRQQKGSRGSASSRARTVGWGPILALCSTRSLSHLPPNLRLTYSAQRETGSGDQFEDHRNLSFNKQHLSVNLRGKGRGADRGERPPFTTCGSAKGSLGL